VATILVSIGLDLGWKHLRHSRGPGTEVPSGTGVAAA
jgi:hypothetical protein